MRQHFTAYCICVQKWGEEASHPRCWHLGRLNCAAHPHPDFFSLNYMGTIHVHSRQRFNFLTPPFLSSLMLWNS